MIELIAGFLALALLITSLTVIGLLWIFRRAADKISKCFELMEHDVALLESLSPRSHTDLR